MQTASLNFTKAKQMKLYNSDNVFELMVEPEYGSTEYDPLEILIRREEEEERAANAAVVIRAMTRVHRQPWYKPQLSKL